MNESIKRLTEAMKGYGNLDCIINSMLCIEEDDEVETIEDLALYLEEDLSDGFR